jgi:hypothetical protein
MELPADRDVERGTIGFLDHTPLRISGFLVGRSRRKKSGTTPFEDEQNARDIVPAILAQAAHGTAPAWLVDSGCTRSAGAAAAHRGYKRSMAVLWSGQASAEIYLCTPWARNASVVAGEMKRRSFVCQSGALIVCLPYLIDDARAQPRFPLMTLLSAPLELGGEWGGSPRNDAFAVISRMREACLSGVRLLSDRQPAKLRVDEHTGGLPHIWLHDANPDTAWIVVDIGAGDWCKLAYQFGHELGHVLCNSWQRRAEPKLPSQWLEEALVEAFSIRGLGLLADSWEERPPFPDDAAFADAIRKYRQDLIDKYTKPAERRPVLDRCGWLRRNRDALDHTGGVDVIEGPEIVQIVAELEGDRACVEDLGAVNRWPARSAVPVEEYLRLWQTSCAEIDASGRLPARLAQSLCAG